MRMLALLALGAVLAAPVLADDLGLTVPPKPRLLVSPNVPDQERQGGDTIANATVIPSLPYQDSGTTTGYTNDYEEICPYSGGVAPDVVYRFTPGGSTAPTIDLCGSGYDTKLYVYDAGLNLIACNDDFYYGGPCGVYVSKLENVAMTAGMTYYIVIDGYGNASGSYELSVTQYVTNCYYPHPDNEGEPPLVDDYVDHHNGGCNTPPEYPFQEIAGDDTGQAFLSATTGWYTFSGANYRDTDWYLLTMGPGGVIEAEVCAPFATYFFELGPQVCGQVSVLQSVVNAGEHDMVMTISGYEPGAPVWFWAGPTVFSSPGFDTYGYLVWFDGLATPVAVEATTWSQVKALYR